MLETQFVAVVGRRSTSRKVIGTPVDPTDEPVFPPFVRQIESEKEQECELVTRLVRHLCCFSFVALSLELDAPALHGLRHEILKYID
jgi:hypothetical protein